MRRKMTCSTKNLDVFWPRTWPAGENPASYHMKRAAETAKATEMIMKRMKDIEKAELFLLFGTEHGLSAETRLRSSG